MNYPPPGNQLRILLVIFIASLGALSPRSAVAQGIIFPTDGNCNRNLTVLAGPGGAVYFSSGQFFSYQGTPTLTTCASNFITMAFSPAATQVSFSVKNFFPVSEDILVSMPEGDVTYTLAPNASQGVNVVGDSLGGVTVRSADFHLGIFGIMGLSVTQPQPNIGFVTFDFPLPLLRHRTRPRF